MTDLTPNSKTLKNSWPRSRYASLIEAKKNSLGCRTFYLPTYVHQIAWQKKKKRGEKEEEKKSLDDRPFPATARNDPTTNPTPYPYPYSYPLFTLTPVKPNRMFRNGSRRERKGISVGKKTLIKKSILVTT